MARKKNTTYRPHVTDVQDAKMRTVEDLLARLEDAVREMDAHDQATDRTSFKAKCKACDTQIMSIHKDIRQVYKDLTGLLDEYRLRYQPHT